MASSINSPALTKFKCHFCSTIPTEDQINQCSLGHTLCLTCASLNLLCKCASKTLVKMPNPLLEIVQSTKKECPYKNNGCTWLISEAGNIDEHCAECKYRQYRCVGAQLGIWSCGWMGMQQDFVVHMEDSHSSNGEFYTHWQSDSVEFDPNKNCTKFNVINAFNKKFIFFYMSLEKNANLIFLIYLLGRKVDAQKYMIDFELKNELRKVKFIETCFSDADNMATVIKDHRCIVLPKKLAETYAQNGRLHFRFVIKKKDSIEFENVEKNQHLLSNVLGRAAPNQFVPKTQMTTHRSENNLNLNATRLNNGFANYKPRYRRDSNK